MVKPELFKDEYFKLDSDSLDELADDDIEPPKKVKTIRKDIKPEGTPSPDSKRKRIRAGTP